MSCPVFCKKEQGPNWPHSLPIPKICSGYPPGSGLRCGKTIKTAFFFVAVFFQPFLHYFVRLGCIGFCRLDARTAIRVILVFAEIYGFGELPAN